MSGLPSETVLAFKLFGLDLTKLQLTSEAPCDPIEDSKDFLASASDSNDLLNEIKVKAEVVEDFLDVAFDPKVEEEQEISEEEDYMMQAEDPDSDYEPPQKLPKKAEPAEGRKRVVGAKKSGRGVKKSSKDGYEALAFDQLQLKLLNKCADPSLGI